MVIDKRSASFVSQIRITGFTCKHTITIAKHKRSFDMRLCARRRRFMESRNGHPRHFQHPRGPHMITRRLVRRPVIWLTLISRASNCEVHEEAEVDNSEQADGTHTVLEKFAPIQMMTVTTRRNARFEGHIIFGPLHRLPWQTVPNRTSATCSTKKKCTEDTGIKFDVKDAADKDL